ncbi:MAG: hypothetical protein IPL79_05940 [Myxococcales bacterium]|nr:hypothetical protein [Myxococcales bacterium]
MSADPASTRASRPWPARPPMSTRRRVIATLGMVVALTWLAQTLCRQQAAQQVELVLAFGDRALAWRDVRVDIMRGTDLMAWSSQTFAEGTAKRETTFKTSLPAGDYTFEIVATTREGQVVRETRRGTIGEATRLTIDLSASAATRGSD